MTKTQTKKKAVFKKLNVANNTITILDLGCGDVCITPEQAVQHALVKPDDLGKIKVIGVDFYTDSADVKHDLTKAPYPFADNSIDGAFSSHFVEHLTGEQRIVFYDEMSRILKPGARMRLIHPYYKSSRAVQDPTHKFPPICEESYLYWNKNWRDANKLGHYLGNSNFDFNIFYTWQDPTWANKNEETRNFAIRHYFNIVADMIVDLTKI